MTQLAGRIDEAEHMVNAPDWTFLSIQPVDGPLLQPGEPEMLSHHQSLDHRHGILTRSNRYRDSAGRTTRVVSRQFQSMADPHLAVIETTVEAEDWAGDMEVVSAINAAAGNRNSKADSHLSGDHLMAIGGSRLDEETVLWESRTMQSGIAIAMALRTRLRNAVGEPVTVRRRPLLDAVRAGFSIHFAVEPGRPVTIEKSAAAVTSRDRALSTAPLSASSRIARAPEPETLLRAHMIAWDDLWPGWQALPFLDSATPQVLGIFNASLIVSAAVNLANAAVDLRWFRAVGEIATSIVGLSVFARIWTVFPFDFGNSTFDWPLVVRILLVLACVGCAISILMQFVILLRLAWGMPAGSHEGHAPSRTGHHGRSEP